MRRSLGVLLDLKSWKNTGKCKVYIENMGCCSQRRPELPLSAPVPTDIQALRHPFNSTANSYTSAHLDALLASPFPPPDKLSDNGTEELHYVHNKRTLQPMGRIDKGVANCSLTKLTCSKCERRAAGYCVQCRLRRFCPACFREVHRGHQKHVYVEYAVCKDPKDLLI